MGFKVKKKNTFWALLVLESMGARYIELTSMKEEPPLRKGETWGQEHPHHCIVMDITDIDDGPADGCDCSQCESMKNMNYKHNLCVDGWKDITGFELEPGVLTKLTIEVKKIG